MSREMKANDSPNHFMVLDAIGRGMNTADKISKVTKLDITEVELILNDLTVQRLVNRMEKKGFFRSKKIEFAINETGHGLLNSKKRELEQKTKDIQQAYGNGNTAQLQSFMGTDRAWIPFLLFSGLLDVVFFASMMSFMGMAMSPQESSMAGDAGGASESASGSDTTGQEDSGAADAGSDSGGGDFEGGGFDSSGGSGMDFGGDFNF